MEPDNDDSETSESVPSGNRRKILKLAGLVGATGIGGVAAGESSVGGVGQKADHSAEHQTCLPSEDASGDPTATWTVEAAEQIERTDANTAPLIEEIDEVAPNLHVWDTWPLRNRDGSVACVNGWTVVFALTAPDAVLPGKRHDIAEIRYFYTREGYDWRLGGPVFVPGSAKGNRQWAASAVYDEETDDVFIFYTATGRSGNPNDPRSDDVEITYEQRLALAEGPTLETTREGVDFKGVWNHSVILTPDGDMYQTQEQAGDGIIYSFRDPWYFEDPETECKYLLFEGNTPTDPEETDCESAELEDGDYRSGVAATGAQFNGSVGIAVSTAEDDMSEWELRPPLLDAVCVNQQLERGNMVVLNGKYYLFFDSHKFTFPENLDGPDGMYGFVADSIHGDYEPLNESGLVVANPEEAPFQAYSWMPVPYGDDQIAVLSYYNYFDLGDTTLTGAGDLPREDQQAKFGGTFAPTLLVTVDGDTTEIVDELDPGFLPSECSNPPAPVTTDDDEDEETTEDGEEQ